MGMRRAHRQKEKINKKTQALRQLSNAFVQQTGPLAKKEIDKKKQGGTRHCSSAWKNEEVLALGGQEKKGMGGGFDGHISHGEKEKKKCAPGEPI